MSSHELLKTPEEIIREFERQEAENVYYSESDEDVSEPEDGHITDDQEDDDFDVPPFEVDSSDEGDSQVRKILYGRNGYCWNTHPFHKKASRVPAKNIVVHARGALGKAINETSPLKLFELLFTSDMVALIVTYTNQKIATSREKFTSPQWYIGDTNQNEIKALFGLLFMSGALKNAHLNCTDAWSVVYGSPFFRGVMTKNRFEFLINNLRFDDQHTRVQRRTADKFAAFRDLWCMFVKHSQELYSPSALLTIDETLLSFRGRCPFKMYLPSKPDKYGLKIISLCDAKTYYFYAGIPYLGKETRDKCVSIPTYYVMKLCEPVYGTNRNITMDNWFASCEVADKLADKKLTMVGTLRKNKPEIPESLLLSKNRPVSSSVFIYRREKMLESYIPKKNRNVILLSTMHEIGEIDETTKKSNIVLFYNDNKGGVDVFDLLCHNKTTARKTRRWTMRYMYGLLDASGINAYVLYKDNGGTNSRSNFLKSLAFGLVEGEMKDRITRKNLPKELRITMEQILTHFGSDIPRSAAQPETISKKSGRCFLCSRKEDRKSSFECCVCSKPVCKDHRKNICQSCHNSLV